jgi:hypothetical protein
MGSVGFVAIRPRRLLGVMFTTALAFSGFGCHQHYYYSGDACPPPAPTTSAVRAGTVCDVPTEVVEGGTKVAGGASRSTVVTGAVPSTSSSTRVVVSEPRESSSESARNQWKRSDPDSSPNPSTTVQGSINDPSVIR